MRGHRKLFWAYIGALVLLLGPVTASASAAGRLFIAPVEGEITRHFEPPTKQFGPGHRGVDYEVPFGTAVKASGAGTVTFAGAVADDGLFIAIEHLGGVSTTYSFLSRIKISNGDRVSQGQTIGLSGAGHFVGSESFHFGAKQDGKYIDPEILLSNFDDITDLISLDQLEADNSLTSAHSAFRNLQPGSSSGGRPGVPETLGSLPGDASVPAAGGSVQLRLPVENEPRTRLPSAPSSALSDAESSPAKEPSALLPPDAGLSPRQWWDQLSPEEKKRFIEADWKKWAHEPGVSAKDRDTINRLVLDEKILQLREYRDSPAGQREIQRQKWGNWAKGIFLSPLSVRSKFDRESSIERKLRSAEALKKQLTEITRDPRNRLKKSDVYLLDFDIEFADGDGKAVVALGDPGKADHIGVFVPGINNAVGTIDGALEDAAILKSEVHRRIDEELGKRTSTIAWVGYDNPNGLHDAMNRGEALYGAPRLERFVNQLREGHEISPQTPHISVFGHSYGSTVAGLAALGGMKADDVVLFGSPGVGERFVGAEDFSQRIWAARTWLDIIGAVSTALGSDPASLEFNALRVPLGPDQRSHSDYIMRGTLGTLNFAKILTGRTETQK